MRISIRTKLVVLMAAVTLVPLVVSLVVIVLGSQNFRDEIVGRGVFAQAVTESRVMQTRLEDDIRMIRVVMNDPLVLSALDNASLQAQADRASLVQQADALDLQWTSLKPEALGAYLDSPIAKLLRSVRHGESVISEVIVADCLGRVLAATNKTSDFVQSDEEWWQVAMADGGKVVVYPIGYDQSVAAWTIDFVMPIQRAGGAKPLGVVKASILLERWLPQHGQFGFSESGWYRICQKDGHAFRSEAITEGKNVRRLLHQKLPQTLLDVLNTLESPGRWVIQEDRFVAYVPLFQQRGIPLKKVQFPQVYLELTFPMAATRIGLDGTSFMILLAGLGVIAVVFLIGVLLIDQSLLRRIYRIRRSSQKIAAGDLKERVDVSWRLTRLMGYDELDDLGREINHMVRQLHAGREDVEQANDLKENFLRIAGHELRTPVSYIVGMAALMKESDDIERMRKAIDTMGFKAERLNEIIQAMFKLIPGEALHEGLDSQAISLRELVDTVRDEMDHWLVRRGQTLNVILPEEEIEIYADRPKLVDIIENLLMNAIKFTPDGGTVTLRMSKQLGQNLAIKVIDKGPGIPLEDQPHLFKPFYSGADVLRHSTGKSGFKKRGMGLGLAIVKHFVMLHHGTIRFDTSEKGTTFTVTIPLLRADYVL